MKSHSVMECYKADARIAELKARAEAAEKERDAMRDALNHENSNVLACSLRGALKARDRAWAKIHATEADAARLRAALEEYADTANWYVDRQEGPAHWGWLGGDPTAIAQLALRPDEQPAESEGTK